MTTKNGDMPAMPIQLADGEVWSEEYDTADGLTKREMMAMAAMQGLVASSDCGYSDCKYMAEDAVSIADALLAELERTK